MSFRDVTGWVLLAVAIAFGVLAFFLMRGYLSSREEAMRLDLMSGRAETTRVIVAKHKLQAGDVISGATVSVGRLPSQYVPSEAVVPGTFDKVKGKVLNRDMGAGETLQKDFVAGMVIDRFSDLLEEGQRAVSIQVASLQNTSGMLLPGDYVDLFVLLDDQPSAVQQRLKPVLGRVKVLAAGEHSLHTHNQSYQHLPGGGAKYSQITVGVSLAQAERLVVARDEGRIVVFLRNAEDKRRIAGLYPAGNAPQAEGYWYSSGTIPQGERRHSPRLSDAGTPALGLSAFQFGAGQGAEK
ncbi:Flp pilus assembly protein CpaB [Salinisphaera sp.]|uniref:Flp pilus assembly protein CpaB n=1 Tax=Salinisphaera sp. TaxID=1914330 RepID=UPI002D798EB0|nr:Flp pilus assembly protein CpaB [Salinisphaera sp.]HET7314078.1 Flp pilus assembly protein CpaB [Salinisphaera sp.]